MGRPEILGSVLHQGLGGEVEEISPATQFRLFRMLQEKEIERVGENRPRPVDVRILAATNSDLAGQVRRGAFREDQYYRLDVVPVQVPGQAQRREDIPLLVEHFLALAAAKSGEEITGLAPEAFELLNDYAWPGNVPKLRQPVGAPAAAGSKAIRREAERQKLIEALRQTGGNQSKAAELLGVCRTTVWNRINRPGIDCERDL